MTGRPVLFWAGLLATGMAVTGCASGPPRTMSRPATPMASNGSMAQTPAWNNPPASMAGRQQTATPATPTDNNPSIQQAGGSAMPAGAGQTGGAPMNQAAPIPNNLNTSQFNATPVNNTNFPSGTPSSPYLSRQTTPPNPLPANVTNSDQITPSPSSPTTTRITAPPPPPQFEDGPPMTQGPTPTTDMPPISAKPAADSGPTPPQPPTPVQK